MLAGLLSLATAGVATYTALHRALFPWLSAVECAAAAAPVGFTLSAWLALILKSTAFAGTPGIPSLLVWTLCTIQGVAAVAGMRAVRANATQQAEVTTRQLVTALLPAGIALSPAVLWFAYIFYTHSLGQWAHGFFVGGSTYGDMPFHLNVINSFLHGINSHATLFTGFKAVFFAGAPLVYPYIPDWHIAVLVGGGCSLPVAFSAAGISLVASFLVLLFCFNLRLTSSRSAAVVATYFTLLCGGIGGFVWLATDGTWSGLKQVDHILYVVNSGPASILWLSLPAHILLPQRTTQYAYPVVLLALILLLRAYRVPASKPGARATPGAATAAAVNRKSGARRSTATRSACLLDVEWVAVSAGRRTTLLATAGLVTGLLPLLQAHSFVAVGVVALTIAGAQAVLLASAGSRGVKLAPGQSIPVLLKGWIVYGVAAFALALPQLLVYMGKVTGHKRFARFEGVWVDQHESGPLPLWWESLGLFVPLNLLALFRAPLSAATFWFQTGLLAVFVVANTVIFQPWEVDNTKVFYVWVFGASGAVAQYLVHVWHGGERRFIGKLGGILRKAVVLAVGGSLVLSGVLCVIGETLSFSLMYDTADVEAADWFIANTPVDAVIATTSEGTHFRPESALAGRQVLVGYPGWMESHGMPWHQRNDDIMNMYKGENVRAIALKYNITHIVIDWDHLGRDQVNLRPINSIAYRAASNGRYVVYKVAPRPMLENVVDCMPGVSATEEECLKAGCEWVPYSLGAWCQVQAVRSVVDGTQPVPPVEDCGTLGITESQCLERGCSWYTGYARGPWCHYPVTAPGSDTATHGLGGMVTPGRPDEDCAWATVTASQCRMRGCDWTPRAGLRARTDIAVWSRLAVQVVGPSCAAEPRDTLPYAACRFQQCANSMSYGPQWPAEAVVAHARKDSPADLLRSLADRDLNAPLSDAKLPYCSPISLCAHFGAVKCVEALLARNVTVTTAAAAGGAGTIPPVFVAVARAHIGVLRHLLSHPCVNVNAVDAEGMSLLYLAACVGDVDVLKELLSAGASPLAAVDTTKDTPLHAASSCGWLPVVQLLVDKCSVPVDAVNRSGATPAYFAAAGNHVDVLEYLALHCGADCCAQTSIGSTLLTRAAWRGATDTVSFLLRHKLCPVDACNRHGGTALICAADQGHLPIVKHLCALGAVVDATTRTGYTALCLACARNHLDVARYLLVSAKASPSLASHKQVHCVHEAAEHGHLGVLQLLVQHGADVMARTERGSTPLNRAAWKGHLPVVQWLVQTAAVDANVTNHSGGTPTMAAAEKGHLEVVQWLVEHGDADLQAQTIQGTTALMCAAEGGHHEVVQYLLSKGADPAVLNHFHHNALSCACGKGHASTVRLLLVASSASAVNRVDVTRGTPLIYAAGSGDVETVRLLVDAGARVNHVGPSGMTAWLHAAAKGSVEMLRLLCERGARRLASNSTGNCAIHLAVRGGHLDAVRYILRTDPSELDRSVPQGYTPALFAAESGNVDMLRLLHGEGANMHARLSRGSTTLTRAAFLGMLDAVKFLVEEVGMSVEGANHHGGTPLIAASEPGHAAVVEYLVHIARADLDAVTVAGETALILAAHANRPAVVKLLLVGRLEPDGTRTRTDPNIRSVQQRTALAYAAARMHRDVVDLLLQEEFGTVVDDHVLSYVPLDAPVRSQLTNVQRQQLAWQRRRPVVELAVLLSARGAGKATPKPLGLAVTPTRGGVKRRRSARLLGLQPEQASLPGLCCLLQMDGVHRAVGTRCYRPTLADVLKFV